MNACRAALVLVLAGLLAACDSSAPPTQQPAQTQTVQPQVRTDQPTSTTTTLAPVPSTELPASVAAAPVPRPANERPLSQRDLAVLQPLFGTWAADLRNCDRGAIRISRTRFEGAENGCDITSLVDTGGWNFVATLACRSQNQTARERIGMVPLYSPTGEAVGLTYIDRGNQQVTVYRCD